MDTTVDGPGGECRSRRIATYNTFNLFGEHRGDEVARYEQVAEVIRGLDADVVAVQEIISDYSPDAGPLLGRLAKMAGMTAAVTPAWVSEDDGQDATYAVGVGANGFHVGLMWRPDDPGIQPDPRSLRSWGGGTFFHALVKLTVRVDGRPIGLASYHAPPFGRQMRADQAERVLGALTRPPGSVLVGGDLNCVGAARIIDADGAIIRWTSSGSVG